MTLDQLSQLAGVAVLAIVGLTLAADLAFGFVAWPSADEDHQNAQED